jgi:hypothetical protein
VPIHPKVGRVAGGGGGEVRETWGFDSFMCDSVSRGERGVESANTGKTPFPAKKAMALSLRNVGGETLIGSIDDEKH